MESAVGVEKNIRIAFQGPLTGPEAQTGRNQLDGVKFAVHHFNERFAGTFKVSVTEVDDQGDPVIAQRLAPSIAADSSILGLVGPSYSGATNASIPFYKAQNLAMISPTASNLSLTDPAKGRTGYPVFHRVFSTEKMQGSALYKVAIQGVTAPRVLVVDDMSDYPMALSRNVREAAGPQTIVGTESLIKSNNSSSWQNDWASAVNKVKTLGVNVVIYTGYYAQGAAFFTHLKSNGYTGILAGGDGMLENSIFKLGIPSPILEGVRISSPYGLVSDINTDLENNFKRVIGRASEIFAPESIDATNVLLSCIASGVTSRIEMLACIDKFSGTSIYGHKFSFDANGDVVPQNFYEFEIRSGAIRYKDSSNRSTLSSEVIIESFPWHYALKYPISNATLADRTCRPSTKTAKVGLAYDIGGRGGSFNASAAAGLDWLKINCGTSVQEATLTTGSDSEREDKLRLLAKAGYNPIIAVGFLYAGPIKAVASDYPGTQFAILDDASVDLLNVASVVFAEEQGSYLAGVAAALASKSGKVGYIGGVRIPLLQKFEAGFVAGVKATKKSATVDVKYVTEPPDFSGLNDRAKAQVIAKGMIDKGVDVIYSAAGGSGAGNFAAATDAAKAGKKVWTIGVDSDQYLTASVEEKKNMLTSVVKRLDVAVYDLITTLADGLSVSDTLFLDSPIFGRRYGVIQGGVSLSYSGGYLENFKSEIINAENGIRSGQIVVPSKPTLEFQTPAQSKAKFDQIASYLNRSNRLIDSFNQLSEIADQLLADLDDAIDTPSTSALAPLNLRVLELERKINDSDNIWRIIKEIEVSECTDLKGVNSQYFENVQDVCAEFIDSNNAAYDALKAAELGGSVAITKLVDFANLKSDLEQKIDITQIITYIDRSNAVLEKLYAHADSADALNVKITDSIDAVSFSSALTYSLQVSALRSSLLKLSEELDDLIAQNSLCAAVNADESNTLESNTAIEACAEFGDAVIYAISAFGEAETNTEATEAQLVLFNAAKTAADKAAGDKAAADLKAKQEADAKAASALKAKQEADAKAAADLKAKQEADEKAAADLKAKQEADAKAAAALKAKQEADAKAAADLKAKQEADAKAAAALRAQLEADAKAAAALRAQLEADAKATAALRAKQEADTKAAAEKATADLRAKQEADTKAAAEKAAADLKAKQEADTKTAAAKAAAAKAAAAKAAAAKAKKSGKVTCKKGAIVKVFVAKKCPAGYTK